ncbi:ArsR/SmtB family transcription factor [Agromyces sp. NPDC058110]|uniref:ArsR/SmtB family transcription factor n=1 Tax=Agromyces sp. NPDC058110 TaxID=3346345 RepID=UPI0036D7EFDC
MLHPFEILAEPVRRRIVEILAGGSHPVGMLTDAVTAEFDISRSAVSHHLRMLRDARAVTVTPDLTVRHYRLDERFLHRLDDAVGELFVLWDHRYGFGSGADGSEGSDENARPGRMPLGPVSPSRVSHVDRRSPVNPSQPGPACRPHRAGGKGRRGSPSRGTWDLREE